MEPSEALRNISYLSQSSLVIVNTATTVPFTVPLGQSSYPTLETIMAKLEEAAGRVIQLDAARIAEAAGSLLTTNVVMLGALFGTELLPIKIATIKEAIEKRFPAKAAPLNLKAFDLGYEACRQALKK
jgi:indolepyruvate ferredoxin oxidoreductase beta subunit